MNLDPFVIASMLGSIFLLSFTVAFLYHIYSKEKKIDESRSRMAHDSEKIIEEAHAKAKQIIERAVERAQQTLTDSDFVKKDILDNLEKDLSDLSKATVQMLRDQSIQFSTEYKKILDQMREENSGILAQTKGASDEVESLKQQLIADLRTKTASLADDTTKRLDEETAEISHEYKNALAQTVQQYREKAFQTIARIEQIPEEELRDFREILKKETVASQHVLSERINQAFDTAQAEIGEYKKIQIEKIDASVAVIAQKVIETVLNDSLTREDHTKLIQAALEQAKKDKVFDMLGYATPESNNNSYAA